MARLRHITCTWGSGIFRGGFMQTKSDLMYSTVVGTSIGFVAGALMGLVQLLYVPELATWTSGRIIVGICAIGWAGYGAIAGGAGIFKRTIYDETQVKSEHAPAGLKSAV